LGYTNGIIIIIITKTTLGFWKWFTKRTFRTKTGWVWIRGVVPKIWDFTLQPLKLTNTNLVH